MEPRIGDRREGKEVRAVLLGSTFWGFAASVSSPALLQRDAPISTMQEKRHGLVKCCWQRSTVAQAVKLVQGRGLSLSALGPSPSLSNLGP